MPSGTRVLPTDRGAAPGGDSTGGAECSRGRADRGTAPSPVRRVGQPTSEPGVADSGDRAQIVVRVQVPGSSSVPLSSFATALRVNALRSRPQRFKACACAWRDESIGESDSPVRTAADATSRLLVDLGAVLFQQQCSAWQRTGKAWTSRSKIEGAIHYFLKGMRVGAAAHLRRYLFLRRTPALRQPRRDGREQQK